MAKFDYKKWLIENKHGIINEQPEGWASSCGNEYFDSYFSEDNLNSLCEWWTTQGTTYTCSGYEGATLQNCLESWANAMSAYPNMPNYQFFQFTTPGTFENGTEDFFPAEGAIGGECCEGYSPPVLPTICTSGQLTGEYIYENWEWAQMPGICEPTTCGMTYGLWCAGVIGAGPGGDGLLGDASEAIQASLNSNNPDFNATPGMDSTACGCFDEGGYALPSVDIPDNGEGTTPPTPQGMPQAMANTGSDAWTGAAGGTETDFTQGDFDFNTDCSNFNQIPQDFQDTICNACDGGQVNMHCECCDQPDTSSGDVPNVPSTGVGPGFTGGTSPGYGSDEYVPPNIGGGNAPGQTMVSTGGMGKAEPMSKKKINKKLKEIYNKITKKINKLK